MDHVYLDVKDITVLGYESWLANRIIVQHNKH